MKIFRFIIFLNIVAPTILDFTTNRNIYDKYCPNTALNLCEPPSEHIACQFQFHDEEKDYPEFCKEENMIHFNTATLPPEEAEGIVKMINGFRGQLNKGTLIGANNETLPRALGLQPAEWDPDLAAFGQLMADNCVLKREYCSKSSGYNLQRINFRWSSNNSPAVQAGSILKKQLESISKDDILNKPSLENTTSPGSASASRFLPIVQKGTLYIGCGFLINGDDDLKYLQCYITANITKGEQVYEFAKDKSPQFGCTECPLWQKPNEDCLCVPFEFSTLSTVPFSKKVKLSMINESVVRSTTVLPRAIGEKRSKSNKKGNYSLTLLVFPILQDEKTTLIGQPQTRRFRLHSLLADKEFISSPKIKNISSFPEENFKKITMSALKKQLKTTDKQTMAAVDLLTKNNEDLLTTTIANTFDPLHSLLEALKGKDTFQNNFGTTSALDKGLEVTDNERSRADDDLTTTPASYVITNDPLLPLLQALKGNGDSQRNDEDYFAENTTETTTDLELVASNEAEVPPVDLEREFDPLHLPVR